ncbi:GNAT family N-acetyltransferase [Candidatus Bathyarchaeota archaeon]|nr:GNAT family N-acetyltransferase [Candidatus Bathyarchaeota archaeon]
MAPLFSSFSQYFAFHVIYFFDRTERKGGSRVKCYCCKEEAVYKCAVCGKAVCGRHARLGVICQPCTKGSGAKHVAVRRGSNNDRCAIRMFVKRFWGEEEQLTFDREFVVAELPAFVAKIKGDVIGFISYAEMGDALVIAALGVLPEYQAAGVGKSLVKRVEAEAVELGKERLLVSTSNDDLPALAFYQQLGFQIFDVKPDAIAKKHGRVLEGIGGLPLRDELRLRKRLSRKTYNRRHRTSG